MERMREGLAEKEREYWRGSQSYGFSLHSCSIPLFFGLQTIATLSEMSEPEVVASAFRRQAAMHSSGSFQPVSNQRGRAVLQRVPRTYRLLICFQDDPFGARIPPPDLSLSLFFSLPSIYTVPSSLPLCSSWLYLKFGESGEEEE